MRSVRLRFAMLPKLSMVLAVVPHRHCRPPFLPSLPAVPRRTISLASRVPHLGLGESRGSGDGVAWARSECLVYRGDQLL